MFIDRKEQREDITARSMNEKDFQNVIGKHLLKAVYEQIRFARTEVGVGEQ
jgi:hypothetical protein